MQFKNSQGRFGLVAIFLHWSMAILIIGLLILGLYMNTFPRGLEKLKLYGWHKEYGLLALWLIIVRSFWRILNVTPDLSLPWMERWAARGMHYAFYILMFAMPLTGWLITSAAGLAPSFFGLFTLPLLLAPSKGLQHFFHLVHRWLAYGLIACIVLHASAAFKHHFINKDTILRRMLP